MTDFVFRFFRLLAFAAALTVAASGAWAQNAPAPADVQADEPNNNQCVLAGHYVFDKLESLQNQTQHAAEQMCLEAFRDLKIKNGGTACQKTCVNTWREDHSRFSRVK